MGASADDGYWATAYALFDNAGADGDALGNISTYTINVFCRFTGVTIPAGATINSATLQLYFKTVWSGDDPKCTIYADDQSNPSAVSGYSNGDGRAKTTASVAAELPESGTWSSYTITAIIQELVASYSYASGNAMQFLLIGNNAGNGYIAIHSYNTDATKAMKLSIVYTEAASGSVIPVFMNQYRRRW